MKLNRKIYIVCGAIIAVIILIFIYCVLFVSGAMASRENNLLISSDNATFTYDGNEHFKHSYSIAYGEIAQNEKLDVNFAAKITDTGKTDNVFTVKVLNDKNADVTAKYNIKCVYGILRVVPREITIKTSTSFKEYDGYELKGDSSEIVAGNLVLDDKIVINYTSKIIDVGTTYNIVDTKVYRDKEDVSYNYSISYDYGTLTVTPQDLIIESESLSKEYDGKRLTARSYNLVKGQLAIGDIIVPNYTGEITNVGTTPNTFSVDIVNSKGDSKLQSYNITYIYGNLNIYERELIVKTEGATKVYDGKAITSSNFECLNKEDILPNDKLVGKCIGTQTEAKTSSNYFEGHVESNGKENPNYKITTILGDLTVNKKSIKLVGKDSSKEYDGYYLSSSEYELIGSLVDGHKVEVSSSCSIKDVGKKENVLNAKVLNDGTDVTFNYDVEIVNANLEITKRLLVLSSESAQLVYDGNSHSYNKITQAGGSLVSIDSIKTFDFKSFNKPGEEENTFLVEIDHNGEDVTSNYDIICNYGTITIDKRRIEFTSASTSKVYDKTPVSLENVSLTDGTLPDKYTYDISYLSKPLEVGIYQNKFEATILDSDGTNTTDFFDINYRYGKIEIKKIPYIIKSKSITKPYSSNCEGLEIKEYEHISGSLLTGDSIYVYYKSILYLPGSIDNEIDAIVFDENGCNVTNYYDLDLIYGTLTYDVGVSENKTLNLYPESLYFPYDGEVKCFNNTTNKINGLTELVNEGYTYKANVSGMGKDLGIYQTEITSFHLYKDDVEVTNFYEINYSHGTIQIYQGEISISTPNLFKKEYDGVALTSNSCVLEGTLASNHKLEITKYSSLNKVGIITNAVSYVIIDSITHDDVSYLYKVNKKFGTLEITNKHQISLSIDESSIDENSELTKAKLLWNGLLPGHTIAKYEITKHEVNQQGKQIVTLKIENITISDENGNDVTSNYIIKTEDSIVIK